MTPEEAFRAAMRTAGLDCAGPIVGDGTLHRFKAEGDHGRNSWYVLHMGSPSAGAFGCWKRGLRETWCGGNGHLSQAEWQGVRQRWQEAEQLRKQSEAERQRRAQATAAWILNRSRPARTLHRYLARKRVKLFGDVREWRDALVLPLCDAHGALNSLQFIGEDGSKHFLTGGRTAGCSYKLADKPDGALVLCEGYATGASIHEATGFAVISAMHAGNLAPVAESLRSMFPSREIVIAADNDQFADGNPGLTKASEVALRIQAKLAVPQFQDLATKPTDFNDVHQLAGLAEVARQIHGAAEMLPHVPPVVDLHAGPPKSVSSPIITLHEDEDDVDDSPTPFPMDSLPPAMALIAAGVSRVARVPDRLSGPCVLGVISAAVGAGLQIQAEPPPQKPLRANLYILVLALTGTGKTLTFELIAAPLLNYQADLQDRWLTETGPYLQSQIRAAEAKIKKLEKDIEKESDPDESERLRAQLQFRFAEVEDFKRRNVEPVLVAQDVTTERLASMTEEQGEVIFSASSDCRKVVSNILGRYSRDSAGKKKETDESFYLAGYSGDYVRVDRGNRPPVRLRRPCLGLLWYGQPDLLDTMLSRDSLSASGFMQRLLMCQSHAMPQKIDGKTQSIPERVLNDWSRLVDGILRAYHQPAVCHVLQLLPEVHQRFVDYHNHLVDRRLTDLHDVDGYVARWKENAWRLSLVLHAGLHGAAAHDHLISLETANNAIRLMEWFAAEQLNVLGRTRQEAARKQEDAVRLLIESTRVRKGQDFTTARDVQRAHIVPTAETAKALLASMEVDGLLVGKDTTPPGGGKTTREFRLPHNPVPE